MKIDSNEDHDWRLQSSCKLCDKTIENISESNDEVPQRSPHRAQDTRKLLKHYYKAASKEAAKRASNGNLDPEQYSTYSVKGSEDKKRMSV